MVFEGENPQVPDDQWVPAPVKKGFWFHYKLFFTSKDRKLSQAFGNFQTVEAGTFLKNFKGVIKNSIFTIMGKLQGRQNKPLNLSNFNQKYLPNLKGDFHICKFFTKRHFTPLPVLKKKLFKNHVNYILWRHYRVSGDHSRSGVAQEWVQSVWPASSRLHLPHGGDEGVRVRQGKLAPAHAGLALSQALWWLRSFRR
jgi:hypothetical protein